MELCGKGSLFKLIKKAREVSQLPPEVLSSAVPPRNAKERELKASRPSYRSILGLLDIESFSQHKSQSIQSWFRRRLSCCFKYKTGAWQNVSA